MFELLKFLIGIFGSQKVIKCVFMNGIRLALKLVWGQGHWTF
jgi:hypothetical protein